MARKLTGGDDRVWPTWACTTAWWLEKIIVPVLSFSDSGVCTEYVLRILRPVERGG
jgi:hypothetical protein